jgi:hypothetical protein
LDMDSTRFRKRSTGLFVHADAMASRSCCRLYGGTFILRTAHSISSRRCSIGFGQQQCSDTLWCSIGIKGRNVCQENIPHTSTPLPPACIVDTRQDGSMDSYCLRQILTLPSAWRNRIGICWTRQCFSTPQLSSVACPLKPFLVFSW